MIVSGYVATADQWALFEKQWLARLKSDNLLYFRRSECASNTGQFVGWDKRLVEKDKLLRDLIGVINSNTICKTGCIVENRILKAILSPEVETQFHLHAYAFAGIVSVSELYKWRDREHISAPIEWIFEQGDDGANELRKCMDIFGTSEPKFREKVERRDRKGKPLMAFTGLQAADFLAWEMAQLKRGIFSPYLISLDEKTGDPAEHQVKSIEELNELLRKAATHDEFQKKIKEKQSSKQRLRKHRDQA
jgi:hypothetical protein